MKNLLVSFLFLSFLSACASTSLSDDDRLAIINKYLKENNITSVKKVTSFRFYGWQSIDNNQLIISTSANKKFLITLISYCQGLNFANSIIVKQTLNSTLQTRFDSIQVPGMHQFKCYIKSINPLNRKQARELIKLVKNPSDEKNNSEI